MPIAERAATSQAPLPFGSVRGDTLVLSAVVLGGLVATYTFDAPLKRTAIDELGGEEGEGGAGEGGAGDPGVSGGAETGAELSAVAAAPTEAPQ